MKEKNSTLRILWAPFSLVYGIVIALRHILYDEHILPSFTPQIPTICVGNLAVGGTGKTPFVEYLIDLLQPNFKIAVLSRGYGRKTHGFVLADEKASATTIGDEPMQIHCKYPHIPVAVCADRMSGIKHLRKLYPDLQAILLDDAFQHRKIRCGLNILLTSFGKLYTHDKILPWGQLRDLKTRSRKADIVVVTKCPNTMQPIDKRITANALHLATFQQLSFASMQQGDIPDGNPLIVTGIASPQYILDYVKASRPQAGFLRYRDHHRYTEKDIKTILELSQQFDYVLTTEKDLMRLRETSLPKSLGERLKTLDVKTVLIDDKENLDKKIITYISESIRKSLIKK